jgi:hypothetical protein
LSPSIGIAAESQTVKSSKSHNQDKMKTTAIAIVPCARNIDGSVIFQYKGPNLTTASWSVHRRGEDGALHWETDARNERTAHVYANALARDQGIKVEPYAWAPTELLTACELALRTRFGLDLFDAGVNAEEDLHAQGYSTVEQANDFALAIGKKYGMERIDI